MQSFLITLLICSVTMSALALLYLVITPLLAKYYSVTGRYYAWLILIVGLIIPFRPKYSNPIISVDLPNNTGMLSHGAAIPLSPTTAVTTPTSAVASISGGQIAVTVWLVGMLLFLAYYLVKHYRFLKLTARWSEAVTDEMALTLLHELKAQMHLPQSSISLQVCSSIGSPMLIGFVKPRILLPEKDFTKEELGFILKHELVHYKRKDLWYKILVFLATAIHWFNPVVYLMAKVIDIQCELSCDAEVVQNTNAKVRFSYSKTILGVIRYKSKLTTAFSTHFYGGEKGMKTRIFSIMDTGKKKTGISILCAACMLTLGTGAAFAATTTAKNPMEHNPAYTEITPWIATAFLPNPDVYAKYADFGITISEDGTKLLYYGQPVRQFVDEGSEDEAFYLDDMGNVNLSVVRNTTGKITGIEVENIIISEQEAQKYKTAFFTEELKDSAPMAQDIAKVQENFQVGSNKYTPYLPFGITYSATEQSLYYHGQRVRFFIDQSADGIPNAMWTDEAGTINVEVTRNDLGQISEVKSISHEKAQEYLSTVNAQIDVEKLEEELEAKMKAFYPNGIDS